MQFRSAAEAFRLIDDEDSATVIVRYTGNRDELDMLLNTLNKEGPQRWLMRKLQRYSISIKKHEADKLLGRGLSLPAPGLYVQDADGLYHENLGFTLQGISFNPAGNVI